MSQMMIAAAKEPKASPVIWEAEKVLTLSDHQVLRECEKTIERGLKTFLEVGLALARIRDARLYRQTHATFDSYLQERWDISKRHGYRLIDAAEIATNLIETPGGGPPGDPPPGNGGTPPGVTNWSPPKSESQVRPLKGLPAADQRKVWQAAASSAPNGQVTAKHVTAARRALAGQPPRLAAPKEPRVVQVEMERVYDGGDIDRTNCHDLLARTRGFDDPLPELKAVFEFEQDLWVVSLGHHGGCPPNEIVITQEAHRLIPDNSQYKGPGPEEYFAEGRAVLWRGSRLRLGPMVIFKAEGRRPEPPEPKPTKAPSGAVAVRQDIRLAADKALRRLQNLRWLADQSRFGPKVLMHLNVAVTHLKNFRNSVEQAAKLASTAAEVKQNQITARAARRSMASRASRARWAKATVRRAYLLRKPGDPPTFMTEGGKWSDHQVDAKRFGSATEAKLHLGRRRAEVVYDFAKP